MKKILQLLRENINAQITALASATGKEVEAIRAGLQSQLTQLAELDKLPEAEVNSAFADAVKLQQEHSKRLFDEVQTLRASLATTTTSLNELQAKVTSGELLEKAKVTERCDLAKQAGRDECAPEIAELRKKVVSKLPTPPDNVLKLPTAEFNAAIADAEANLESAGKVGLSLEGRGAAFLKRALFSKKDAFATELAELKDLGLTGEPGDAFKGGSGDDGDQNPENKTRARLC